MQGSTVAAFWVQVQVQQAMVSGNQQARKHQREQPSCCQPRGRYCGVQQILCSLAYSGRLQPFTAAEGCCTHPAASWLTGSGCCGTPSTPGDGGGQHEWLAASKLECHACRADLQRAGMMCGSASSRCCRADTQLMRACGMGGGRVRGGGADEELLWQRQTRGLLGGAATAGGMCNTCCSQGYRLAPVSSPAPATLPHQLAVH